MRSVPQQPKTNLYSTAHEIAAGLVGNGGLFTNRLTDVDDRTGYRTGQPWALQSLRVPTKTLEVFFKDGDVDNQPISSIPNNPFKNITSVKLKGIHIYGLESGSYSAYALVFHQENHGFYGNCLQTVGLNKFPTFNTLVVPADSSLGHVTFFPPEPILLALNMQPQVIERFTVTLKGFGPDPVPVEYSSMMLVLELESELWQ